MGQSLIVEAQNGNEGLNPSDHEKLLWRSKMVEELVDVTLPPPRTKLEVQLKYRGSKLHNQLKTI